MPTLNDYRDECHLASADAGWWPEDKLTDPNFHAVKVALIHSEASEMLEGIRTDAMDAHLPHIRAAEVEAADLLIRLFDLAGALGWDLDSAYEEKRAYNKWRHDHTAAVRGSPGGKKF